MTPTFCVCRQDNPCAHPIIILRDVTHADLSAIVTYMYQGEVNVAPEALRTFLHTAQLLKVKGLADTGIKQEVSSRRVAPEGSQGSLQGSYWGSRMSRAGSLSGH